MTESFLLFTNSSTLLVFLKYHLKCFSLTPCITKINHMWKYHLIFFFCNFIIDFFLFGSCSTKGAALRKVPHKGLSPLENSGNNVVVPELNITGDLKLIQQTVLGRYDLLKSLTHKVIHIFVTAKEYIYELISGAWIKCYIIQQNIYSLKQ